MTLPDDGFRVIVQEETPLLRATATLYDLHSRGAEVADIVEFERYSVPVVDAHEGKQMGSAHLYLSQGCIKVTLVLDYHSPERLDLQVGAKLYATPEGSYYLRSKDMKMDYVDVTAIVLSTDPKDVTSVPVELISFE